MRKVLFSLAALAAALAANAGATPAATTAWVSNYVNGTVADYVTRQSSTTTATGASAKVYTAGKATLTIEVATVYALMATNATTAAVSAGVTNGMFFVWDETNHSYTNHAQTIEATKTNFVWSGVSSVGSVFSNYFGVLSFRLQPTFASEVTK